MNSPKELIPYSENPINTHFARAETPFLKYKIQKILVIINILLFFIWGLIVSTSFVFKGPERSKDWSNVVIPGLLFIVLISSSYFAGNFLNVKLRNANKLSLKAVIASSLMVSFAISGTLFLVLLIGYYIYKMPVALIVFVPILMFFVFWVFSFILHLMVVWFAIPKNKR